MGEKSFPNIRTGAGTVATQKNIMRLGTAVNEASCHLEVGNHLLVELSHPPLRLTLERACTMPPQSQVKVADEFHKPRRATSSDRWTSPIAR